MILWLDDDTDTSLRSYLDELEYCGYLVKRSRSPDEFFNDLRNNLGKVQAIIMDIMIPTGDSITPQESKSGLITGQRVIEKIKEDKATKSIPILILTVVGRQETRNWATSKKIPYLEKSRTFANDLVFQTNQLIQG